jgi:hypothetical protein
MGPSSFVLSVGMSLCCIDFAQLQTDWEEVCEDMFEGLSIDYDLDWAFEVVGNDLDLFDHVSGEYLRILILWKGISHVSVFGIVLETLQEISHREAQEMSEHC